MAADQALAFAQKAGASMYVETSAKMSRKTVVAAFELAATVAATFRRTQNQSSSALGTLDILDVEFIAKCDIIISAVKMKILQRWSDRYFIYPFQLPSQF